MQDEDYSDFLQSLDTTEPDSQSFRDDLDYFKRRIDSLNREADDREVEAMLSTLGPNCSIHLLKKVKAAYEARLFNIEHAVIPNLFSAEGATRVDYDDGSRIEIVTEYESRTVDKAKAIDWLESTGHGDAVRDTLDFLPGSLDEKAITFLKEGQYSFSIDKTVNGQTLKKIIKEMISAGMSPPPVDAIKFRADKVASFVYPKKRF